MNPDIQTILALIARHGLTTLAGILAAHGYLSSSTTEQFVSAGMLIAGVVWSWWQKRGEALALAEMQRLAKLVQIYKSAPASPSPNDGKAQPTK